MKKNSDFLNLLVIFVALALIFVGGISLNKFELSGDATLDYFRFMFSIGGIILGCMIVGISIVSLRGKA